MLINIRGTSGSGKSTLVREVTKLYTQRTAFRVEGRKQPLGYVFTRPSGRSLAVVGHYETACGGCDTIPSLDRIIELVRQSHIAGHDVLFEGLLIASEYTRTVQLHHDGLPLRVVQLTTPLDLCLESINLRRRAKTPDKEDVNPKNTTTKFRGVLSICNKLEASGVPVQRLDRAVALTYIKQELGFND